METIVNYVLAIPGMLFWVELSTGVVRRGIQALSALAGIVAFGGLLIYVLGGSGTALLQFSFLIAIFAMVAIGVLVTIPRIRDKCLVLQSGVVRTVLPAMALLVVFVNLGLFFGKPPARWIESVGFAIWVTALGYEAASRTFAKERRLFSIESELDTARQIQESTLPKEVPAVSGLRIAAMYKPMSVVAGDFYHFLALDEQRVGVLVADVTGHGVPAALIASMIKIALQSVAGSATEPGELLHNLNRILTPELAGHLTSAAYLYLDAGGGAMRYSGAGHPPLFHWKSKQGVLEHVESNGLLFGITADAEYPMQYASVSRRDRLLLYTDGLTEPENAAGEAFGERRLEQVLSEYRNLGSPALVEKLLEELRAWQPPSQSQQDDITLIVVDVT